MHSDMKMIPGSVMVARGGVRVLCAAVIVFSNMIGDRRKFDFVPTFFYFGRDLCGWEIQFAEMCSGVASFGGCVDGCSFDYCLMFRVHQSGNRTLVGVEVNLKHPGDRVAFFKGVAPLKKSPSP